MKYFSLLLLSILCLNAWAQNSSVIEFKEHANQLEFNAHSLETSGSGNIGILCLDIDRDGRKDVVSVDPKKELLCWYRQLASPLEFERIVIDDNLNGQYLDAVDVNQDQVPDILCSLPLNEGGIVYFESMLLGDSIYWNRNEITDSFAGAHQLQWADVDLDGDYDVLAAANMLNRISWWEQTGRGWTEHPLVEDYPGVQAFAVEDFNNDGYPDFVSGHMTNESGNVDLWLSNPEPDLHWEAQNLATNVFGAHWFELADMNNDGLNDILIAAYLSKKVFLWERLPGDSMVFKQNDAPLGVSYPLHVETADLDNDGDMDILVPEIIGSNHKLLAFIRNEEGFQREVLREYFNAPWQIIAADMDNDGDQDFIAGSFYYPNPNLAADLSLFENMLLCTGVMETIDYKNFRFRCSPNPARDHFFVEFENPMEQRLQLEIFDQNGRLVLKLMDSVLSQGQHKFRFTQELKAGTYFCKLIGGGYSEVQKLIVLQ